MALWLLIVVGIGALVLVALILAARSSPASSGEVDPLLITGIAVTGASVALITTMGVTAIPMIVVGIASMAVGAHRSRSPR